MKFRVGFLVALCLSFAVSASAQYLYANGPVDGICDVEGCTVDAWTINFGFTVTNSFTVQDGSVIHGANFAFRLIPDRGAVVTSVDWQIGTSPFGSDIASGTASGASLSDVFLSTNQFGYEIDNVSISGLDVGPLNGSTTYWLTLANAVVSNGDPVYWEENNGPSQGQENSVGTIPSECFNIVGATTTTTTGTVPEPSNIMLFGSGIIGLVGVLRCKLF